MTTQTQNITGKGPGRPRLYDWDYLLDGNSRYLTPGVDYQCSTASMLSQVRMEARKRDLSVESGLMEDASCIWVQSFSAPVPYCIPGDQPGANYEGTGDVSRPEGLSAGRWYRVQEIAYQSAVEANPKGLLELRCQRTAGRFEARRLAMASLKRIDGEWARAEDVVDACVALTAWHLTVWSALVSDF